MAGRRKRRDSPHLAAAGVLASEIRRRRTALGWSQQKLAGQAGLAYGTIRAIERGAVTEPGLFTVRSIADAFGSKVDELLGEASNALEEVPDLGDPAHTALSLARRPGGPSAPLG